MFFKKFEIWVYIVLFFQLLYMFENSHDKKLEKILSIKKLTCSCPKIYDMIIN